MQMLCIVKPQALAKLKLNGPNPTRSLVTNRDQRTTIRGKEKRGESPGFITFHRFLGRRQLLGTLIKNSHGSNQPTL